MMKPFVWERVQYRIAWVLLLTLTVIAVFGTSLMPHSIQPEDQIHFTSKLVDGKSVYAVPPFAPSADYWLGTDHRGFDILSLLLNGAKYTLGFALLVTVSRFLLAVPLGLLIGTTGKGRSILSLSALVTSAAPAMLFIFPTMYALQKNMAGQHALTNLLFAMLVFFGVFQLAQQFAERTHFYNNKLYITAARMMGASTSRIAIRHILPHLRPEVLFMFLTDLGHVLFLIGQLAVLSIFLGGASSFQVDFTYKFMLTDSGEWGAMIAYGVKNVQSYPWILGSAAMALTISTLILWFFSAQLQKQQKRPERFANRGIWLKFKDIRVSKKWIGIGTGVAVAVSVVVMMIVQTVQLYNQVAPTTKTSAKPISPISLHGNVEIKTSDDITPSTRAYLNRMVGPFMENMAKGNWDYASVFVAESLIPKGTKEVPKPFDEWLRLLSSKEYEYVEIGKATDITPEPGSKQMDDGEINVEFRMKNNKTGEIESWHVIMTMNTIVEVKAGPGFE